jgi:hypothetical protein
MTFYYREESFTDVPSGKRERARRRSCSEARVDTHLNTGLTHGEPRSPTLKLFPV